MWWYVLVCSEPIDGVPVPEIRRRISVVLRKSRSTELWIAKNLVTRCEGEGHMLSVQYCTHQSYRCTVHCVIYCVLRPPFASDRYLHILG